MDFINSHRPPGLAGKGDRHLPQLAQDLERLLSRVVRSLAFETLRLPNDGLEELAGVLVEFGEDIHNNIGIWNSLEHYNLEFFGTRLPFVVGPDERDRRPANEHRLQHLLWVMYSELKPELLLSPTHRDLTHLAISVSTFLGKRFAGIPRGSAVKAFLGRPNTFGWDVKRKLVWLGTHSYLFRNGFRNYAGAHEKLPLIPLTDDFVCQQTTAWSGLGVIDILAATLDMSPERRATLRGWYERHTALYRVAAIKGGTMELLNAISGKTYTVRMGEGANPFRVGQVVVGSLVPWNGEWYWAGQQSAYDDMAEGQLQSLRTSFLKDSPVVAYRYCDDLAEKAWRGLDTHHREFAAYHGDDLAVYPNGLAMASDLQKEWRLQWQSQPAEAVARAMAEHKLPNPWPSTSFPRELLEHEEGVAVYYNRDEGQEMMTGFNDILAGLKKRGQDLTDDEASGIREFVSSDHISPAFVKRVVREYGYESIESAFLIRGDHKDYHLDYLLRRYKGAYYRKRHPRIALV
ncbi:MAG: DUF3843 family protein [Chloroflexi bacterium]|nr:DUF3843 family protein [Chloroflexota bacterium]